MKGRKPKLKVVKGDGIPAPPGGPPEPPAWIHEYAQDEWDRVTPGLHARGLLSDSTLATLESYCIAVGTVRECEETMRDEGRTIVVEGKPMKHPASVIQATAMREARLLAAELRLTRMGSANGDAGEKQRDEFADLLA